jgi:hypothetical protein
MWKVWWSRRGHRWWCTRWFKYDRDKLWLVYTQLVPVIFEPPCNIAHVLCMLGKATNMHAHTDVPVYPPFPPPHNTHTHTHTQKYIILIAFPQQQLLCEHAWMLHHTYMLILFIFSNYIYSYKVSDTQIWRHRFRGCYLTTVYTFWG